MRKFLFALLFVALPAAASAQELDEGSTLRLGMAGGGVVGLAEAGNAAAFNPTFHLDIGAQLSRVIGLYVHGEIGAFPAVQAAVYLVGEVRVMPRLTLGTGIGWDGMAKIGVACLDDATDGCPSNTWSAVSVPLIVGIDLGRRNAKTVIRLNLEIAGGLAISDGSPGWHSAVTLGWQWQ